MVAVAHCMALARVGQRVKVSAMSGTPGAPQANLALQTWVMVWVMACACSSYDQRQDFLAQSRGRYLAVPLLDLDADGASAKVFRRAERRAGAHKWINN